jgi:hypothetical protein
MTLPNDTAPDLIIKTKDGVLVYRYVPAEATEKILIQSTIFGKQHYISTSWTSPIRRDIPSEENL